MSLHGINNNLFDAGMIREPRPTAPAAIAPGAPTPGMFDKACPVRKASFGLVASVGSIPKYPRAPSLTGSINRFKALDADDSSVTGCSSGDIVSRETSPPSAKLLRVNDAFVNVGPSKVGAPKTSLANPFAAFCTPRSLTFNCLNTSSNCARAVSPPPLLPFSPFISPRLPNAIPIDLDDPISALSNTFLAREPRAALSPGKSSSTSPPSANALTLSLGLGKRFTPPRLPNNSLAVFTLGTLIMDRAPRKSHHSMRQ
jgi:hypothetical protein